MILLNKSLYNVLMQDMEKWAKSLNAQKEAIKDTFKKGPLMIGGVRMPERESGSADAGFAILEKRVCIHCG